ncbi:MAG: hypothetical protein K6U08_05070, partial [Firmicutes bacterium]|nr:hypothetical protein [Bacillota bacterium]
MRPEGNVRPGARSTGGRTRSSSSSSAAGREITGRTFSGVSSTSAAGCGLMRVAAGLTAPAARLLSPAAVPEAGTSLGGAAFVSGAGAASDSSGSRLGQRREVSHVGSGLAALSPR